MSSEPVEKVDKTDRIDKVDKARSKKSKKPKPARVQKDPSDNDDQLPQTGTVYNVWYLKWSGGDKDDSAYSQRKAEYRCSIAKDAGYTKADKIPGSYFCLYFARGMCSRGKDCDYLHRLPNLDDRFPQHVDCFGRDRFADYRDDMGGVGSFLRQARTIYVGRINPTSNVEEIVSRHFQEWGEIERIRVLNDRGVAFVTYVNEANSQFAKEAMAHQSLDNTEILNVRWASEDPNPAAKSREKRRIEEEAMDAVRRLLPSEDEQMQNKRKKIEAKSEEKETEEDTEQLSIEPAPEAQESFVPEPISKQGLISDTILAALQSGRQAAPVPKKVLNLVDEYDSD